MWEERGIKARRGKRAVSQGGRAHVTITTGEERGGDPGTWLWVPRGGGRGRGEGRTGGRNSAELGDDQMREHG